MKLSVIIPVFNEAATIETLLRRVQESKLETEIIVVDDNSTDGSREILEGIRDDNVKVLYHKKNRGKGAALRTGLSHVTGDIVIIQDADLEYDPAEYPDLIDLIEKGKADAVYGSRFLGRHRAFLFSHYLGNKFLTLLANILYGATLTDIETCYKAFRADVLKNIKIESNSFGFEAEITAKLYKRNLRVYEVPITYQGRSYDEGKKATYKDGFIAVYWLLACKFGKVDVGREARARIPLMRRYNSFILDRAKPYLGQRILEIGARIGNVTRQLLGRELVVASEMRDDHLETLHSWLPETDRLKIVKYDITDGENALLRDLRIDTIYAMNVLEHVKDDTEALRNLNRILQPSGRVILILPAMEFLYGASDRALEHKRRYTKASIAEKFRLAGFELEHVSYMNMLGVLPWFVNSRIFRRKRLPQMQLRILNLLSPLFRAERLIGPPFGLSLLAVGRKTD